MMSAVWCTRSIGSRGNRRQMLTIDLPSVVRRLSEEAHYHAITRA